MKDKAMVSGRGAAVVMVGDRQMLFVPHVVQQLVALKAVKKIRGNKFEAVEHFTFWDAMKQIQD